MGGALSWHAVSHHITFYVRTVAAASNHTGQHSKKKWEVNQLENGTMLLALQNITPPNGQPAVYQRLLVKVQLFYRVEWERECVCSSHPIAFASGLATIRARENGHNRAEKVQRCPRILTKSGELGGGICPVWYWGEFPKSNYCVTQYEPSTYPCILIRSDKWNFFFQWWCPPIRKFEKESVY